MNITANPWSVCLEVQKYLKKKVRHRFRNQ